MKAFVVSSGCGASADGSNWNRSGWHRGRVGDGTICYNCPEREVEKYPEARRLMTHPGVGLLSALAFVLIIGEVARPVPLALQVELARGGTGV